MLLLDAHPKICLCRLRRADMNRSWRVFVDLVVAGYVCAARWDGDRDVLDFFWLHKVIRCNQGLCGIVNRFKVVAQNEVKH